jgi:hypothetical protein
MTAHVEIMSVEDMAVADRQGRPPDLIDTVEQIGD